MQTSPTELLTGRTLSEMELSLERRYYKLREKLEEAEAAEFQAHMQRGPESANAVRPDEAMYDTLHDLQEEMRDHNLFLYAMPV